MAHFRRGDYEQAIEWVTPVIRQRGAARLALAHCFLAMSQHQLNRHDEARKSLIEAQKILDPVFNRFKRGGQLPADWHDWLFAQTARREAEELINSEE